MKTLKYSRQRESIKTFLMNRYDHPTADVIYAGIRQEYPNVSLGTVYRNLNLLVDLGEVLKISCGDGKDHFDGNANPHYHLVCEHCGAVVDLPMEYLPDINRLAQACTTGTVKSHSIIFYGSCEDCADAKTLMQTPTGSADEKNKSN